MVKKTIDYFEVEVKFNVRKGSYSAKTKKMLEDNISNGIGGHEMDGIEPEDIEIKIK